MSVRIGLNIAVNDDNHTQLLERITNTTPGSAEEAITLYAREGTLRRAGQHTDFQNLLQQATPDTRKAYQFLLMGFGKLTPKAHELIPQLGYSFDNECTNNENHIREILTAQGVSEELIDEINRNCITLTWT